MRKERRGSAGVIEGMCWTVLIDRRIVILTRLMTLSMPASLAIAGAEIKSGIPMPWKKRIKWRRKDRRGMRSEKKKGDKGRREGKERICTGGVCTLMFFTMPFSTTASKRFLTFLAVIFTSLPPHVLSSTDLRGAGEGGKVGQG